MVAHHLTSAKNRLVHAIDYIPGAPVAYIRNPKVACTNVKWSLISAFAPDKLASVGKIHKKEETPFALDHDVVRVLRQKDVTVFSLVRHPRRRFISAYFNKLYNSRFPTGQKIFESVDLDPKRNHPPKAILKGLLRLPTQDLDPHVAPQVVNLLWGSIPYDRVFRLESLKSKEDPLIFDHFQLPMLDRSRHSTQHKVDLSLFDDEDYEMIDHLYREDYAAFGYDPNPDAPISAEVELQLFEPFLLDLMTHRSPVRVIKSHFRIGFIEMMRRRQHTAPPRPLNYLEVGGMIDVLHQHRLLTRLSRRLRDVVTQSAMATGENAERLRLSLAELEAPPQDQNDG